MTGLAVAFLALPLPESVAAEAILPPDSSVDSPGWVAGIREEFAQAEYRATRVRGGIQAPNRAQNIRVWFDERGALATPRQAAAVDQAPWRWGLVLEGWGWKGALDHLPAAAPPMIEGNTVRYDRGAGLIEEHVNAPAGLKSNYHLAWPPAGIPGDVIRLELSLRGDTSPVPSADGRGISFISPGGQRVIDYSGLKAWDAAGRELACRLALEGHGPAQRIVLEVHAGRATFPLTIDPLATTPAWTAEGGQANASFGASVASAGDVNGDGFSDVIIGAPLYDNGHTDEGRAAVYLGSATGLTTTPAWTVHGGQADALLGYSARSAGDVNGDGFSDVIVGAMGFDNGEPAEGWAYLYLGSPSGLSATPAWTAQGDQANARFGISVASAGDVNGDGFSDVIVGASQFSNPEGFEGKAFLYLGSAAGPTTAPAWTAEGNRINARFGYSAISAGDVNSDGFGDVIVGAYGYSNPDNAEGAAFLYLGSPSGLATTASWSAEGGQAIAFFGIAVAAAGDVNGDGFSDVIVGAYAHDNAHTDEGRAYIFHGSPSGLSPSPAWTADGGQPGAQFGFAVAPAGDLNRDGFSDVIIGARRFTSIHPNEGRAFIYHGSATGLAPTPAWTANGGLPDAQFGVSVAPAGDVNGDGFPDILVGADWHSNGPTRQGRAYLFLGSAPPASVADWQLFE